MDKPNKNNRLKVDFADSEKTRFKGFNLFKYTKNNNLQLFTFENVKSKQAIYHRVQGVEDREKRSFSPDFGAWNHHFLRLKSRFVII